MIVQEIPPASIVERMQAPQVVDSFPLLEDFAAAVLLHISFQEIPEIQVVERIQGQSAVTDLVNPPISITAVEAVDSFSVSEEVALNTSSTVMLDSLKNIEKEVERAAMLTKRMMETPLPEPPMVEPPMVEPDRTSAKRRRRTRYTPLPGILENAVFLALSAWPPVRHA